MLHCVSYFLFKCSLYFYDDFDFGNHSEIAAYMRDCREDLFYRKRGIFIKYFVKNKKKRLCSLFSACRIRSPGHILRSLDTNSTLGIAYNIFNVVVNDRLRVLGIFTDHERSTKESNVFTGVYPQ